MTNEIIQFCKSSMIGQEPDGCPPIKKYSIYIDQSESFSIMLGHAVVNSGHQPPGAGSVSVGSYF